LPGGKQNRSRSRGFERADFLVDRGR